MIPQVRVSLSDGGLGIVGSSGRNLVVIGPTSAGPKNLPTPETSVDQLVADFGGGDAVDAAALAIGLYGLTAIVISTTASTDGTRGDLDADTGITLASTQPTITRDADVLVRITRGGSVGVSSTIQYQVSTDGGISFAPAVALGAATSITVPGLVALTLTGALEAGDQAHVLVTGPEATAADLGPALDALRQYGPDWRIAYIATPATSQIVGALDIAFILMRSKNIARRYIISAPTPEVDDEGMYETEAEYAERLAGLRAAVATTQGAVAAGAVYQVSPIDGGDRRMPFGAVAAARRAALSPEQNTAALKFGALPGARLIDSAGRAIDGLHDELHAPGLSDMGYLVARSWQGRGGTYVNTEPLFSPPNSDYDLITRGLVMDLAHETLADNLSFRLSDPVPVDAEGRIDEATAVDIELNAIAAVKAVLNGTTRMISSVSVVLSRTDNVFATGQIGVKARIQPLFYPSEILLDLGFSATAAA